MGDENSSPKLCGPLCLTVNVQDISAPIAGVMRALSTRRFTRSSAPLVPHDNASISVPALPSIAESIRPRRRPEAVRTCRRRARCARAVSMRCVMTHDPGFAIPEALDDGLRDDDGEQRPDPGSLVRVELRHDDADELCHRIDPEMRTVGPTPPEAA